MFSYQINEDTQLRLLEYRYDQELYDLIDHNRDNLREWLSWVDGMRSAQDTKSFIGRTRKQWADHEGFTAGIFFIKTPSAESSDSTVSIGVKNIYPSVIGWASNSREKEL